MLMALISCWSDVKISKWSQMKDTLKIFDNTFYLRPIWHLSLREELRIELKYSTMEKNQIHISENTSLMIDAVIREAAL